MEILNKIKLFILSFLKSGKVKQVEEKVLDQIENHLETSMGLPHEVLEVVKKEVEVVIDKTIAEVETKLEETKVVKPRATRKSPEPKKKK